MLQYTSGLSTLTLSSSCLSQLTRRFWSVGSRALEMQPSIYFDVSQTVHLTITLADDQLDAQIFNTFITILYMYMFRAISCSSSGGEIVLIQHPISSLSVSDLSVHRCAPNGHLLTVTLPDAVLIQFDLLRMSKIFLETCTCRRL